MRAEIAALARLDSPYIVRIFEFAEDTREGVLSAQRPRGLCQGRGQRGLPSKKPQRKAEETFKSGAPRPQLST